MKKIIFQDFDGVLNSTRWMVSPERRSIDTGLLMGFDPKACWTSTSNAMLVEPKQIIIPKEFK